MLSLIQTAAIDHAYTEMPFTEHWIDTANQVYFLNFNGTFEILL